MSQVGTRSIKEMGGLADRMPLTAILTLIGFLAIGGVPPTMGFVSKFMIFSGAFDSALTSSNTQVTIAIIAIIMTALTVGYSLWTFRRIFFGPLPERLKEVKEASATMIVLLLVFALLAVVIGIYPKLVSDYVLPFVSSVLSS